MKPRSSQELFFSGDYQGALDSGSRKDQLAFIVGALCFLGRSNEAEILFQQDEHRLSRLKKIQCRFFLGIGLARISKYSDAKRYFAINLAELRHAVTHEEEFYIFQGASFYRYFSGRWKVALRGVERAFQAAIRSDFLYGRVLSSDLRGHLLVQTGQVHAGIAALKDAQKLARTMRNKSIAEGVDSSIVAYEGQFGLTPKTMVQTLKKSVKAASTIQDTFSQSELLLELARQQLIRGKFLEASTCLDRAGQLIYSHQNRRQEAELNLRYAYLCYLNGDPAKGLSFLQSGKRALDPAVDHALRLSLMGMEHRLVKALNMKARESVLEAELRTQSALYGGVVNQRIVGRITGSVVDREVFAGDPMGDIQDLLSKDFGLAVNAILQSQYYSLFYEILPVEKGSQILYLDLDAHSMTLFDRNGVDHQTGLTSLLRSFLNQLASGQKSKEELIRSVWKYPSYHSLRHDSVIYQAVTALRRLLDDRAEWIQNTELGYRLAPGVQIRFHERAERAHAGKKSIPQKAQESEDLNSRQISFLRKLKPQDFVTVHDYRKLFKVSEITATRDLSALHSRGLVVRVGRARATKYALPA
jgi:DNA-binding winged helix-turn-helix (wHTH) protein